MAVDVHPSTRSPRSASRGAACGHDLRAIKIVLHRELLRFFYDRTRMISQLVQPVLWLLVLGTGPGLAGVRRRGRGPEDVHLPRRHRDVGDVHRRCSRRPRSCGTGSSGSCGRCSSRRSAVPRSWSARCLGGAVVATVPGRGASSRWPGWPGCPYDPVDDRPAGRPDVPRARSRSRRSAWCWPRGSEDAVRSSASCRWR